MFSRRRSARQNRGRITGSHQVVISSLFSGPVLMSMQSNIGVSVTSGKVASWADTSGNARSLVQATSANQFTWIQNAINGQGALQSTAGSSFMQSNFGWAPNLITALAVFRMDAWSTTGTNDIFWTSGGGVGATLITDASGSPALHSQCGAAGAPNTGAAVGAWVRAIQYCDGTANSYLKLGSSKISGATGAQPAVSTPFKLGFSTAGRTVAMTIPTLTLLAYLPSDAEIARYEAAVKGMYGSQVGM